MPKKLDFNALLAVAIAEARKGLAEGGIPIGAVIRMSTERLSAPATIAACRMAIHPYTEKLTLSATPAASVATKH
jgi:hypothetical protein